ncbi:MAG: VWA domain-containing protein [Candidatus Latescibacteria bacterium]|nr:VWA domain-containing protein [Candidatus Latescibacterota bacterium]NIM22262.1 VWA domain-containing protein [Candidatus Latescibacterota bacterium]NIM65741.1 VWA domain-containing protein [Candidatus Latescibacterota bacterium]NIO02126.1 VWA domain-containing protein [Candidatus Latescibacterota bacterium]NIO28958.1 VWA domain-containing protein [Candidatus Latescibacterota bacterium]
MAGTRKDSCTAVMVLTLLLLATGGPNRSTAQTKACDYPLFIQQTNAEANVLFVFDNSGSMNEAMYHDDYDPQAEYSGVFVSTKTYYAANSGWRAPRSFDNDWPSSPYAYLVASDHDKAGRYSGNYLNWIYFHATKEQRESIPTVTRIQVAKPAVAAIINNTNNIRFGIMEFNHDEGGHVIAPLGSSKSHLSSKLNEIVATTWTPLAETMVDAFEYLRDENGGAPIQYWCQKTFIVVVTDGFPTMDRNVPEHIGDYDRDAKDPGNCASIGAPYPASNDCSDYLDDVALYVRDQDLRSDLKKIQNAVTYTIGFNIDAGILRETADNGGGVYLSAFNAQQLQETLQNVINDITNRLSSGSAVAVISQETKDTDRLFRAKFAPLTWRGYLEAFALPFSENSSPIWEAGALLQKRDPDSRMIFTAVNGQMLEFTAANAHILERHLGTADRDTVKAIIEYIRGKDISGFRGRLGWKLGDIVDASPVVVGEPKHFYKRLDYHEFRSANAHRKEVIYIGANDGMLHCFGASDGCEKWAFIPGAVLSKLKNLTRPDYCHNYYVNLTPKVADAFIQGHWRTILLGGEKEGGDSYFCLDITHPDYPFLLWEKSVPELKNSWNKPVVARIKSDGTFLGFFTSGPDEKGNAYIVAADLATGKPLWTQLLSSSGSLNMATSPSVIDLDMDGYDDILYVSDLAGHVWRIDIAEAPFKKTLLFQTTQPIQVEPILTVDPKDNVYLYFGTGQYLFPEDISNTDRQTFYCIIDDHSGKKLTRSELVDQTHQINPILSNMKGWFIDLVLAPGERVVKPDALVAGVVYFTSFQPTSEACSAGGRSWLYAVDYLDGSAPDTEEGSEINTTEGRYENLNEGITSRPVIDIVNEKVIVQSSDAKISTIDAKTAIRHLIVRSWRPIYK